MRVFAFPFEFKPVSRRALSRSQIRDVFHRSFVRRFLIRRMAVKTPLCRWACRVRTVREKPDFQTRRRAISRQLSRSLTGSTLPRASPSLRDPYATGSGRAAVRQSSSSRIARAESSRRFRSGSVRLFVCHAKAIHVGHRAPCFRPWCGGTPPRVGSRPTRRGSGEVRAHRRPSRISRAIPKPKCEPKPRRSPRPRRSDLPAFANDASGRSTIPHLDPPPTGRNCSSSLPL